MRTITLLLLAALSGCDARTVSDDVIPDEGGVDLDMAPPADTGVDAAPPDRPRDMAPPVDGGVDAAPPDPPLDMALPADRGVAPRDMAPPPDEGVDAAPAPDAGEPRCHPAPDGPGDNCPGWPNPDQRDADGDGRGDACDLDAGDGVCTVWIEEAGAILGRCDVGPANPCTALAECLCQAPSDMCQADCVIAISQPRALINLSDICSLGDRTMADVVVNRDWRGTWDGDRYRLTASAGCAGIPAGL